MHHCANLHGWHNAELRRPASELNKATDESRFKQFRPNRILPAAIPTFCDSETSISPLATHSQQSDPDKKHPARRSLNLPKPLTHQPHDHLVEFDYAQDFGLCTEALFPAPDDL